MDGNGFVFVQFPGWQVNGMQAKRFNQECTSNIIISKNLTKEEIMRELEPLRNDALVLINPPSVILSELHIFTNTMLYYDRLPTRTGTEFIKKLPVKVPSLAFRYQMRKRGIEAQVQLPVPIREEKSKLIRTDYRKQHDIDDEDSLLWIDDRFLTPKQQTLLHETVPTLKRNHKRLRVSWVSDTLPSTMSQVKVERLQKVALKKSWIAADLFITFGNLRHSYSALHVNLLEHQIPILTSRGGDHDEWVRHLYNGIVLKTSCEKEGMLRFIPQFIQNRSFRQQLKQNTSQLKTAVFKHNVGGVT
ncbi:hypothetical protein IC619_000855 [Hazenella sp. IB182353]|uniref:hypothetical protein n=1 Tax=Polycladospora coralii TaxID=2771432 RepID=UPI001747B532|nr:hypothetical protein [Polycladospora coralii]MBS7529041.1 hypothetical protein [Polycladospora coralii]